jgi:hypothetical protein
MCAGTVVLSTVSCRDLEFNSDTTTSDFWTVEYRQCVAAVGAIPMNRWHSDYTMLSREEILASRCTDRAIRPLLRPPQPVANPTTDRRATAVHYHVHTSVQSYNLHPHHHDDTTTLSRSGSSRGHGLECHRHGGAVAIDRTRGRHGVGCFIRRYHCPRRTCRCVLVVFGTVCGQFQCGHCLGSIGHCVVCHAAHTRRSAAAHCPLHFWWFVGRGPNGHRLMFCPQSTCRSTHCHARSVLEYIARRGIAARHSLFGRFDAPQSRPPQASHGCHCSRRFAPLPIRRHQQ